MARDKIPYNQKGVEYTYICYACNISIIDSMAFPAIVAIDSNGNEIK